MATRKLKLLESKVRDQGDYAAEAETYVEQLNAIGQLMAESSGDGIKHQKALGMLIEEITERASVLLKKAQGEEIDEFDDDDSSD